MTTTPNAIAALLSQAANIQYQKPSAVTPVAKKNDDLSVDVRVVSAFGKPRIEVTFNRFPGQKIIDDFHAAGNWYWKSPSWCAADSQRARDFCNARFDKALEPFDNIPTLPPATPAPISKIVVAPAPEQDNSPLGKYRRQVDELTERLKRPAADIFLEAIDCYHKVTFSN